MNGDSGIEGGGFGEVCSIALEREFVSNDLSSACFGGGIPGWVPGAGGSVPGGCGVGGTLGDQRSSKDASPIDFKNALKRSSAMIVSFI
jgi:hypothetical protein